MSNVLKPLRTLFTAIGGALPAANPLHRGVFAVKKAAATEDELHVGLRDSSDVMQWRRMLTKTYADTLYADDPHTHAYVDEAGDTMTGPLILDMDNDAAFVVRQADNTNAFIVDTNGTKQAKLANATVLLGYSDDGTTIKWEIANGFMLGRDGWDIALYSDQASTLKVRLDGASGDITAAGSIEIDGALNHDGTTVGFFGVAPATRPTTYTVTNLSTDRAYDANATTTAELADVLGTLIEDLRTMGLVT
jgi:hypothetical protein